MNKIINKLSSLSNYYKLLYNLTAPIADIKPLYILFFLFVMLFSAFFEISLLGFLFILIKAFMNPDYYQGNFVFKTLLEFFDINSNQELVLHLSIIFITTCVVAGIFRLFFYYLVSRYVYFFSKTISSMCYQRIIYQDYKNIFSNNTNESLSIFQKMPIVNNSFNNTLLMMYNFITFVFIFSILAYINFKITLISTIFFVFIYLLIILLFKKRIFNNSTTISNEQSNNIKVTRETFNGFRDILINNYQNFYNNLFVKSYSKLSDRNEENRFLSLAPRPIIESFLLASVGVLIAINSDNYDSLEKLLPNIAILAIAAQRVLPILNQLYAGHMNNIEAFPHIIFIKNYIDKPLIMVSKKKIIPMKFKNKISLKNVSFNYSNEKKNKVLKNINIEISSGSRIGIIGKSGSGKSTLADLILGLLNPQSGNILVDGKDIKNIKQSWFSNVSSVPQNIFITDQSIAENIAFGIEKNKIKLKEVKNACKKAQIASFIEAKDDKYNNLIGEKGIKISTGQRQRLAIARALYKKSKLIIFDEATSSLDSDSEKNILNTIFNLNRKRYTLILISHKLSNLKKCDHIYKVYNSRIMKVR